MTIRFTCSGCSSVLKIKDELAGSTGRCPKCKTKFVVPALPSHDHPEVPLATEKLSKSDEIDSTAATDSDILRRPAGANHPVEAPHAVQEESSHQKVPDSNGEGVRPASALTWEFTDSPTVATTRGTSPQQARESASAADVVHEQSSHQDAASVAAQLQTDENLDCPPMFVISRVTLSKAKSDATVSNGSEPARPISENPVKDRKPTPAPKDAGFDPLKFLMSDAPEPHRGQSAKSRLDDSSDDILDESSLEKRHDSDLVLSDESDDEIMSRPTPQPLARRTPLAPSARQVPEKLDLATAALMMKKAIKESQSEVAHQREIEASGFDYGQFFREFGWRGLGIVGGAVVMILACMYVGNMVFSSKLRLPPLGYVYGTVTLDGQPLADATVYFSPVVVENSIEGSKRERARTSVGLTDAKGNYKMMYSNADHIEGVAVGKCQVWVTHIGPKGNDVPGEWMQLSMRTEEVTLGNQKVPFDIKMATKLDPKKKKK